VVTKSAKCISTTGDPASHDAGLGDGRIDDPVRESFRESNELAEYPSMGGKVFSYHKDGFITLHLFSKSFGNSLGA
jgi:hypothetical protein